MYINPYCKTCNGDGVVSVSPPQADYLEEFLPCPDCRDKAMQDIAEVVKETYKGAICTTKTEE